MFDKSGVRPANNGRTGVSMTCRRLGVAVWLAGLVVVTGCSAQSSDRDGLQSVPTRTAAASESTTPSDPDGPIALSDFTVLPTFVCLRESPARAVVTVGWSAPDAAEVSISLDGQVLPVGIADALPYQVPAGGPTGIGAAVVFDCNSADTHTIDLAWSAPGFVAITRSVTVTKEAVDG